MKGLEFNSIRTNLDNGFKLVFYQNQILHPGLEATVNHWFHIRIGKSHPIQCYRKWEREWSKSRPYSKRLRCRRKQKYINKKKKKSRTKTNLNNLSFFLYLVTLIVCVWVCVFLAHTEIFFQRKAFCKNGSKNLATVWVFHSS